ncbi:MAG: M23 family metallopeptidase [Candidatus Paceibacterota bacterium]
MTKEKHNNSAFRIVAECVALFLIIVIPLTVQAKLFSKDSTNKGIILVETGFNNSPLDIPLLTAEHNPDPHNNLGGAEVVVEDGALVSSGPVGEDVIALNRTSTGEISIYTVREGDTLSHIADMYGVTANTILWANDLPKATSIREGQTLVILPIAGVQHVVKSGDTVNSIAKKYDGNVEEILSYNQLASADGLVVGETIVVPGGAIHSAPVIKSASPTSVSGSVAASTAGWTHPAPGAIKSQGLHGYNAVDLAGSVGSSIRAAAAGEVIVSKSSGWNGGYGQYIVIKHSNGTQTLYAHLSSNKVGVGAYVGQGEVIGGMGNTGKSTGSHLHFEVRGGKNPF